MGAIQISDVNLLALLSHFIYYRVSIWCTEKGRCQDEEVPGDIPDYTPGVLQGGCASPPTGAGGTKVCYDDSLSEYPLGDLSLR